MTMAKLNSTTVVRNPAGERVTLFEGQELPAWAEDQVGEHLLSGGQSATSGQASATPAADDNAPVTRGWVRGEGGRILARHMLEAVRELEDADDEPADPDDEDDADPLPPTNGRGSGVEAWAKYADDHGIAYPQGASRDEIIAAVEAHNQQ